LRFSEPSKFIETDLGDPFEGLQTLELADVGLVLIPAKGADLVALVDVRFGEHAAVLDQETIKSKRIFIDIDHWEYPPKDLEWLTQELQSLADGYETGMTLKWRGEDGISKSQDFEPSVPVMPEAPGEPAPVPTPVFARQAQPAVKIAIEPALPPSPPPRALPKPKPRVPSPAVKQDVLPIVPPDPLGADAITFLANRGGMGLLSQSPEQAANFFPHGIRSGKFPKVRIPLQE
jgi:hypothetical protein